MNRHATRCPAIRAATVLAAVALLGTAAPAHAVPLPVVGDLGSTVTGLLGAASTPLVDVGAVQPGGAVSALLADAPAGLVDAVARGEASCAVVDATGRVLGACSEGPRLVGALSGGLAGILLTAVAPASPGAYALVASTPALRPLVAPFTVEPAPAGAPPAAPVEDAEAPLSTSPAPASSHEWVLPWALVFLGLAVLVTLAVAGRRGKREPSAVGERTT